MGEIPMPGGWALSTAWLPECGQTWWGTAAAFMAMWAVMMGAMMLPSLGPLLWRHALALRAGGEARRAARVVRVLLLGAGYFFVWNVLGALVFAGGAALAQLALQLPAVARAAPASLALAVVLAGALQCTARKARYLASCRAAPAAGTTAAAGAAWWHGVRLGLRCSRACAGLTAVLLAIGVMDPWTMALVTAAITAERLAPAGERVAWVTGVAVVVAGLCLMARVMCLRCP